MRSSPVIALFVAGCTPFAEPELLASFGSPSVTYPMVTVEGDRVHVFFEDVHVIELETGETETLGPAAGGTFRYDEVAVTGGRAYWIGHEPSSVPVRHVARIAAGRGRELVVLPGEPANLVGDGGCALFTIGSSLHRWCPDDEVPVEVTADGPIGDVAADDDAYYFFAAAGLTRLERATGERTLLGVDPLDRAQLVIDGDQVVWWRNEQLRAIPTAGGEPIELGTLPETAPFSLPDDLTVDEHGYFLGDARLRRGARDGEVWVPRGWEHAARDGHMVWLEGEGPYRVYHLPTDADPAAPVGGEAGSIRPPFL